MNDEKNALAAGSGKGGRRRRSQGACLLAMCLAVFSFSAAYAHVLPGPHLLLLMTEAFGATGALEVHQRLVFPAEQGALPAPVAYDETLRYRFPDAVRCEIDTPALKRIHVYAAGEHITVRDGRLQSDAAGVFDHYAAVLLSGSREEMDERLTALGIDTAVSSLGRFAGRPLFVLGAQYPDATRPMLWIDKTTFLPLHLFVRASGTAGSAPMLEFRYLDWTKSGRHRYPMRIECYQGETLLRRIVVDRLNWNALLSDALFDIERLRSRYQPEPVPETPSAPDSKSDIQEALDAFKRRYE